MKVKIADFAEVITGGTPDTFNKEYWDNGSIPWLQSGACKNCLVTETNTYITESGLKNSSAKMMAKNSVLIALTGATTGKVGLLKFEACANQSVTGIQPNDSYDSRYLFYFLMKFRKNILADSYGGAQKHISQGYVKDILVPLKSLDKQKEIADKLDKVNNLIEKRKLSINCLDMLIKSRFVEMFDGKYPKAKLGEYISTTSGGTPLRNRSEYYKNGNIPWLSSGEVNQGYIDSTNGYITELGLINSSAKWVPKNSVVIAMYGATAGKVGMLRIPVTTNQAVCVLLPTKIFDKYYLFYAVKQNEMWMLKNRTGAAQPNISQTVIKKMPLIIPPIERQIEFAKIVHQVDKLKSAVQKSLDETQLLFDSLMQEYFG